MPNLKKKKNNQWAPPPKKSNKGSTKPGKQSKPAAITPIIEKKKKKSKVEMDPIKLQDQLRLASVEGDVELVKKCIAKGADVNHVTECGFNILMSVFMSE